MKMLASGGSGAYAQGIMGLAVCPPCSQDADQELLSLLS